MEREKASKLIKQITLVWFVLGLILAGCAYGKLISLDWFQVLFPAGFIIWAVLVTLLSRFTTEKH